MILNKRFFGQNVRISFNYYTEKLSNKNKINNNCGNNINFEKKFFKYIYYGILLFIIYIFFTIIFKIYKNLEIIH